MEAFNRTFGESPENTRGNLFEHRRKQGLSDPPRAAQVGTNSQAATAYHRSRGNTQELSRSHLY